VKSYSSYATPGSTAPRTATEAWIAAAVMMIVYIINIADRYVLSTLIEPIKADLQLSDAGVAFLTGVSLAIFYVAAGLPLGALADRVNRKKMIAISVAVWSGFTALCGLSTGFWQFLLARIGVGVGEAGGTPPSHSLLADKFPPRSRAFMFSIWGLGASIGAWLGASGAGLLADAYGWRNTLVIFGLVGLPVALLVWLCVREPKRGQTDAVQVDPDAPVATLMQTIQHTWRTPALRHLLMGGGIVTLWGWGLAWWIPAFLSRSFALSTGEAGALLGPMHGIGGTALMIATVLVMRLLKNQSMHWQAQFVTFTTLIGTIPGILLFYVNSLEAATWILWIFVPIIYVYIGPSTALVQNLYRPDMRAKGIALLLFTANLCNLAIAPQLVGLFSDWVAANSSTPQESLRTVLFWFAFTGFWATAHYWALAHHMKKSGTV